MYNCSVYLYYILISQPWSPGNRQSEPWIPSWVPDWTSPLTWQRFKRTGRSYSDTASETLRSLMTDELNRDSHLLRESFLILTRLAPASGGESRIVLESGSDSGFKTEC
ncbi:hypothetical protein RRF57_013315 [Xylaria bambusicola]|uniref:Uncharacterized protein n=1 Tax=Xylaria bambusicola TaxID=326684 RepID=A0AAN7URJ9_9PEZI